MQLSFPAAVALLGGSILLVGCRTIGSSVYEKHGRPYVFGSERMFQIAYLGLGVVLIVCGAAMLQAAIEPRLSGLINLWLGFEVAVRSKTLGKVFFQKAGTGPLQQFERVSMVLGVALSLLGVADLLHL